MKFKATVCLYHVSIISSNSESGYILLCFIVDLNKKNAFEELSKESEIVVRL